MSIRIQIAKWLAPEVFEHAEFWEQACGRANDWRHRVIGERERFSRALRNIIALKTPSCAHIGKKMADIAEAAIKSGEG